MREPDLLDAQALTQQWEARAQRARTQEKTAPLTRALKLRHEADVLEDCARELRAAGAYKAGFKAALKSPYKVL